MLWQCVEPKGHSPCVPSVAHIDYARANIMFEDCVIEDGVMTVEYIQNCLSEIPVQSERVNSGAPLIRTLNRLVIALW